MKYWNRVKNCLICGQSRCKESEWIIYCFRYNRAFNKKKLGVGVLRDIVPKQGVLGGQSPPKEKTKEPLQKNIFDNEDNFFLH